MDIINIIDRLEALITTSTKVPTTQRTLLDVNKVQELMDQLRLAVPQDVRAAKEILVNKDDILNLAEAERRRQVLARCFAAHGVVPLELADRLFGEDIARAGRARVGRRLLGCDDLVVGQVEP